MSTTEATDRKNSTLTEDEQRALLFHHKQQWEAAQAALEAAKAARKKVEHLAKAECGKNAVADIKDLILLEQDKGGAAVKAEVSRMRLARWANAPVGSQFTFDEIDKRSDDDRAFEGGKVAGLKGETCLPPSSLAAQQSQKWIDGWHAGQAVALSDFRAKLAREEEDGGEPDDAGDDTESEADDDLSLRPPADDLDIPPELRRA